MARPLKEGMDYFPHDTDAVNDEKIEALRSLYGNDGYAFYFIMLERIYRSKNFEIDVSDAETKEEIFQILSRKILVSKERLEQIFQTALKWNCFDQKWYDEKGIISSKGIKRRAGLVTEKRESMRARYNQNKEDISAAEITQGTEGETPQSKEKKRKDIYIVDSEYLWSLYPDKSGKQNAMKKLPKLIKEYGKDQIERCIKRYLEDVDKRRANGFAELRYKNGSTFFNSGYVDFLDENYQEKANPPVRKLKPIILDMVTK